MLSNHHNLKRADAIVRAAERHVRNNDFTAAVKAYSDALSLVSDHKTAVIGMGRTLRLMKRHSEAITYLQSAVQMAPDDATLHCDFGDILQDMQQWRESVKLYQIALQIDPSMTRAWYSCGCAELASGEYPAAIHCFQKTLELSPEWFEARHNLGRAYFELGQVTESLREFRACAARTDTPNAILSAAMLAVTVTSDPAADNQLVLKERQAWADRSFTSLPATTALGRKASQPVRPIRIGYISTFFAGHHWMKPVWGLINKHNREEFEIHLFSDCALAKIRRGYQPHERDRFHDIGQLSNNAVAALIQENDIDVLIDLNGYSRMQRLGIFPLRPAPVVVGWFNLYGTSGMRAFDYLIGDEHVVLPEDEPFYTEKVLRVNGSWLTFEPLAEAPEVAPPPVIEKKAITFGSMASQYKITPQVIDTWARILRESPSSSLFLKNRALDSPSVREYMRHSFEVRGVNERRICMEGHEEYFRFLKAYDKVDIALETFPYNGGTTTTDAIWQGVPVLTFAGDRWASRMSASILRYGGLADWIAKDVEGYITLAINLANTPGTSQRLDTLRRTMRTQLLASALCDTHSFAREMELIYRQVFGVTKRNS